MICLTLAPVVAPVGLPFGVGAQPWVGDGAILVGTPSVAAGVLLDGGVEVMVGDAVGVSEGELDEVSGTVLGSGPAAGAGLLVEQPPRTAIPINAAAAPGFQTGWIVTASPHFASLSPAAANAPSVSAAAIPYASPGWRLTPARQANAFKPPIAVGHGGTSTTGHQVKGPTLSPRRRVHTRRGSLIRSSACHR